MNFEYRKTKVRKAEVLTITPAMADMMLEKNIGNRKLSPSLVREYASYIRQGLWQENGQAIQITTDGFVVDGQHRLSAVVLADKPISVLVVTVEATDGQGELNAIGMAIDRNKPRGHVDISGIDTRSDQVAAALIRVLMPNGQVKAKNTALRANVYYDLKDSIDAVVHGASRTARLYSRAIIKGTLALRYYQGYDHVDEYRNACLMRMKDLPEIWVSWWRQVGQMEGSDKHAQKRLAAMTWEMTNPEKEYKRAQLTMRDVTIDNAISDMTSVFYDACFMSIAYAEKDLRASKTEEGMLVFNNKMVV